VSIWLPSYFMTLLIFVADVELLLGEVAFQRLQPLGDITYSSYMWHTPLQLMLLLFVGLGLIPGNLFVHGWFLCLFLGTMLIISWLSFHYLERPAQRALRRIMLPGKT